MPPRPSSFLCTTAPITPRKTIESLSKNTLARETDLIILSDAEKGDADRQRVTDVRKFISTVPDRGYFRSVRILEAEQHRGLAGSVIAGVTRVINEAGRVIVLEDDHVTTPDFLTFMNDALVRYQSDHRVWSISGYCPPITLPVDYAESVYFTYRGSSWGYATWKDRWDRVDWAVSDYPTFRKSLTARTRFNRGGRDMAQMLDQQMEGTIDSWAIRWCYAQSKLGALTVYPVHSLVQNIGLDGSGTHSGFASQYSVTVGKAPTKADLCDPFLDKRALASFRNMYGTAAQHVRVSVSRLVRKVIPHRSALNPKASAGHERSAAGQT